MHLVQYKPPTNSLEFIDLIITSHLFSFYLETTCLSHLVYGKHKFNLQLYLNSTHSWNFYEMHGFSGLMTMDILAHDSWKNRVVPRLDCKSLLWRDSAHLFTPSPAHKFKQPLWMGHAFTYSPILFSICVNAVTPKWLLGAVAEGLILCKRRIIEGLYLELH